MQATFYKGEDITFAVSSAVNLSAYTKVVKFFTPLSSIKQATITPIDNFSFSVKLAAADTADLTIGQLNIVFELTSGDKMISKTIGAKMLDPYLDGGVREDASLDSEIIFMQDEIQFTLNFTTPPLTYLNETIAARDAAIQAETDAQAAKTAAETANTSAQTAKIAAETAKTGAETAKTAAETAAGTSITKASEAAASASAFPTTYSLIGYKSRVEADGGSVQDVEKLKFIFDRDGNRIAKATAYFLTVGGVKLRTATNNKYVSKWYNAAPTGATYDAVQGTEANQPDWIGFIAPNEKGKIANLSDNLGDYLQLSTEFTALTNAAWTICLRLKYNGSTSTSQDVIGKPNSSVLRMREDNSNYFRFKSSNGDNADFNTHSTTQYIGKDIHVAFVTNGLNIGMYINGVYIDSKSAATTSINILHVLRGRGGDSLNFNGNITHLSLYNSALSASEITEQYSVFKQLHPEIETIAIGRQQIATSNLAIAQDGAGNAIPEVQVTSATATEKYNTANALGQSDTNAITGLSVTAGTLSASAIDGSVTPTAGLYMTKLVLSAQVDNLSTGDAISLEANKTYMVSFDIYPTAASTLFRVLRQVGSTEVLRSGVTLNANQWNNLKYYFKSGATSTARLLFQINEGNAWTGTYYIDNLKVRDCGWDESQLAYDTIYAQTSGTASVKDLAASRAAAAWCNYDNLATNGAIYGKLYNWWVANLLRLNPIKNFRVMEEQDWYYLASKLGGLSVAGAKLKALFGAFNDSFATNESGLSLLPSKYRNNVGGFTTTESFASFNTGTATYAYVDTTTGALTMVSFSTKIHGFSTRLISIEPYGADNETISTGLVVNILGAGNLDIEVPEGYLVESININSRTGITGLSAKYCSKNWNPSVLTITELNTLFTAQTVVANTPITIPTQVSQNTQRQGAIVRINGTKADTAESFEVQVNIKKIFKAS